MTPREFYSTPFFRYTSIFFAVVYIVYLLIKKNKENNNYYTIAIISLYLIIILGVEYDLAYISIILDLLSSTISFAIVALFAIVFSVIHIIKWNELDPITKTRTILIGIAGIGLFILIMM